MFEEVLASVLGPSWSLPQDVVCRLKLHYELLVRWNRRLNLTAIRSLEEAVERHYCEALFLAEHLPEMVGSVCDVGSGAGFPGLPLAISRPECKVTLVECHQRKAVFLKEASRGLANVKVLCVRAEEVSETFDVVVSRAVGWEDLRKCAKRLAPRLALLTSLKGSEAVMKTSAFELFHVKPLPWGNHRVFLSATWRST